MQDHITTSLSSIRILSQPPLRLHMRWMKETSPAQITGSTGLVLTTRNRAALECLFSANTELRRSISGECVNLELRLLDAEPPKVGVKRGLSGPPMPSEVSSFLAGTHPLDVIRQILYAPGTREWSHVAELCGVEARKLEALAERLRSLHLNSETLVWELAPAPDRLRNLSQWLSDEALRPEDVTALRLLAGSEEPLALLRKLAGLPGRPADRADEQGPWDKLAADILASAAEAAGRSVARDAGLCRCGMLLRLSLRPGAEAEAVWEQMQNGELRLEDGSSSLVGVTGPLGLAVLRQRTVTVELPSQVETEPKEAESLVTGAQVLVCGHQLKVVFGSEPPDPLAELTLQMLSGSFSPRDGYPQGGMDDWTWQHRVPVENGRPPRFWRRLTEFYRFNDVKVPDQGEMELILRVPRNAVERWAEAPHSRDPEFATTFTRIARSLQDATRAWAPLLQLEQSTGALSWKLALPVLIFAASAPRAAKKKFELGYEVIDKEAVWRAIQSAATRFADLYAEFDSARGAVTARGGLRDPRAVSTPMRIVQRYPRGFEYLLRLDNFLIEQSLRLADTSRKLRAAHASDARKAFRQFLKEVKALTKEARSFLRKQAPIDFSGLIPLLMLHATEALGGQGLEPTPPEAFLVVREGGCERWYTNSTVAAEETDCDSPPRVTLVA